MALPSPSTAIQKVLLTHDTDTGPPLVTLPLLPSISVGADHKSGTALVPHEVRIISHAKPMMHVKALGLLNRMLQLTTSYISDSATDFLIVTDIG